MLYQLADHLILCVPCMHPPTLYCTKAAVQKVHADCAGFNCSLRLNHFCSSQHGISLAGSMMDAVDCIAECQRRLGRNFWCGLADGAIRPGCGRRLSMLNRRNHKHAILNICWTGLMQVWDFTQGNLLICMSEKARLLISSRWLARQDPAGFASWTCRSQQWSGCCLEMLRPLTQSSPPLLAALKGPPWRETVP